MEILALLRSSGISPRLPFDEVQEIARKLKEISGTPVYPQSIVAKDGLVYFLSRKRGKKLLGVLCAPQQSATDFQGEEMAVSVEGKELSLRSSPLTHGNALALRRVLEFLQPRLAGLRTSAGLGDRLGLATPGHVRAAQGKRLAVFFAQQSIREMSRTGRTPEQVLNDATWGLFQEGWREGFGADADHLKTPEDVDACIAAGFTLFTVDPGEYVDDAADTDPSPVLTEKIDTLPWEDLETNREDLQRDYVEKRFKAGQFAFSFDEENLLRAAVKYGRAVAHTVRMYRHLAKGIGKDAFELEVSVDETETPTTPLEHLFVACELRRLDVEWVSLAPRFVGRFEKGVDYIGDLQAFEDEFTRHAAIAREFGPYKLSIHSGSDKFSIYPIAARASEGLVHLKTAGTSYLEALRAIALLEPELFRQIAAFAREHYPQDRASYHVSAELSHVPDPHNLDDEALKEMLDEFHSREVLHVTYGSVLDRFGEQLLEVLRKDEETYYQILQQHIGRHLAPFSGS
jgi:hypothetical protein